MAGTARVLVVGEALIDVRLEGEQRSEHPGGSPLNIAVGLARLGVDTTLAAQLGDDDRGQALTAHVKASGVELVRLPPHHPTATATATIRNGSATYEFDIWWDPVRVPDPSGFRLVHVGSIGATLQPGANAVLSLVRASASAGVPVSIDPNLRPAITPDVDQARALVEEMIALASVVKLSDEDSAVLWPSRSLASVVTTLAGGGGGRLVALTRGGDGAVLATDQYQATANAHDVTVADTIGAGDSFMSAVLAGLLTHDLLRTETHNREMLAWLGGLAVEAAALTCSRPGADPPWTHELPSLTAGPPARPNDLSPPPGAIAP